MGMSCSMVCEQRLTKRMVQTQLRPAVRVFQRSKEFWFPIKPNQGVRRARKLGYEVDYVSQSFLLENQRERNLALALFGTTPELAAIILME